MTRLRIEFWFFEEQHGICLCSSFWTEMRWSYTIQERRIFSIPRDLSFRFSAMIGLFKFTRIVNISFKGKKTIFSGIFFLCAFKNRLNGTVPLGPVRGKVTRHVLVTREFTCSTCDFAKCIDISPFRINLYVTPSSSTFIT